MKACGGWLQRRSKPTLVGLILLCCFVIGIALELLADHYQSAFEVQPWDPASELYGVILFGLGLRYVPVVFLVTLGENLLWSLRGENAIPSGIAAGLYLCVGYYSASFLLLHWVNFGLFTPSVRSVHHGEYWCCHQRPSLRKAGRGIARRRHCALRSQAQRPRSGGRFQPSDV